MSETREGTEIQRALEAALAGGPERHHEKTAEQGKLPVRERVSRLIDPESFAEEALLANWDQEGLGADGVVTGMALIGGGRIAPMADGPTVKARSWGPKTGEKILPVPEEAPKHEGRVGYPPGTAGPRVPAPGPT